jgi:hypothetical protein
MTPIYHITHINNLSAILREDGLLCDAEAEGRGLCAQSIAYDSIKERRKRRRVETLQGQPVAAGGVVADYVPFYFCNRSPMLYAIYTKCVPSFQGEERDVIYLMTHVERVAKREAKWCFTDGHAAEGVTQFTDDLNQLTMVNRSVIESWSWKDTLADPDRKRKKQAEFLVHGHFPWAWVEWIGVIDAVMADRVLEILKVASYRPRVTSQPKWYYTTTTKRR